jgi:hypothetical protein
VRLSERPDLRAADGDDVAMLLYHRVGGLAPKMFGDEGRFPLALDGLAAVAHERPADSGEWLRRPFQANGADFVLETWAGDDASKTERLALARVVRSLRFPRLRPGTVTGHGFFVLERSHAYRVGSVAQFEGRDLPVGGGHRRTFHLVRAPRRFYALAGACNLVNGYAGCPGCDVRFDRTAREFSCANGARWDRLGRVLLNPDPQRFRNDPLLVLPTKVGQDGHVLVSTNAYRLPKDDFVDDPWSRLRDDEREPAGRRLRR